MVVSNYCNSLYKVKSEEKLMELLNEMNNKEEAAVWIKKK